MYNDDRFNVVIDYTSIVSGYLKCIEQLEYFIMKECLVHPTGKTYYITSSKSTSFFEQKPGMKKNIDWKVVGNYRHIKFLPKYEKYFKIDMGSLNQFIQDTTELWYTNDTVMQKTVEYLKAYGQECRNDNFHKDMVEDWEIVEAIRNNTILLCFLLLGGRKITGLLEDDKIALQLYDDSYERFYNALQKISDSYCDFYVQFPEEQELKVIRLFDQEYPIYDMDGYLSSSLVFAKVNDFEEFRISEYEEFVKRMTSETTITIQRNNMPEKIWLRLKDNKREEITW